MLAEHVKAPRVNPPYQALCTPDPTQRRYTHRDGIVAVGNDVRCMTGAGGRATESEAAGGGQLG